MSSTVFVSSEGGYLVRPHRLRGQGAAGCGAPEASCGSSAARADDPTPRAPARRMPRTGARVPKRVEVGAAWNAIRATVVPGAIAQVTVSACAGWILPRLLGWSHRRRRIRYVVVSR
jgi:hypothetical protein